MQDFLALFMSTGFGGVEKDAEKAKQLAAAAIPKLMERAKLDDAGAAEAQTCLGVCYHQGLGVAQDPKQALVRSRRSVCTWARL